MKKLYYFIIPALLLGSCQSDPTLETESSPLVRTKVTELQYAQTDKIDVEALNIISPYKFVKKGNLYAFLTPSSAYRFAIYNSENGTVTRLVPAGRNEREGMYFISMNLNGDIVSAFDFGTKKFVEINLNEYATPGYQPTFTSTTTRPLSEPSGSVTACCRPEFIPKAVIASVKHPEPTPIV